MPTRLGPLAVVLADVHERPSGVPEALATLGVPVEIASLRAGDYRIGPILVERKSLPDLHDSIASGRLWRQVDKLRRASRFPFFLVEGANLDDGPIAPKAIRGVCVAVIARGIRLVRTENRGDSALWLHALAVRARRTGTTDRPRHAQQPQPRNTRESAEAVLGAVPGISTVCARSLLSHFGSVAAVAAADTEAWLEVPGIGPDRARALYETFNSRPFDHDAATTTLGARRPGLST